MRSLVALSRYTYRGSTNRQRTPNRETGTQAGTWSMCLKGGILMVSTPDKRPRCAQLTNLDLNGQPAPARTPPPPFVGKTGSKCRTTTRRGEAPCCLRIPVPGGALHACFDLTWPARESVAGPGTSKVYPQSSRTMIVEDVEKRPLRAARISSSFFPRRFSFLFDSPVRLKNKHSCIPARLTTLSFAPSSGRCFPSLLLLDWCAWVNPGHEA
ncbi:hypothetical protein LZ30DRAFT_435319 [Colletotrichum cereale]|nr:hypothetical protein LZ30DRAFT_435319 [Colletotrichum cereale]